MSLSDDKLVSLLRLRERRLGEKISSKNEICLVKSNDKREL